jgi:hypothetical protein
LSRTAALAAHFDVEGRELADRVVPALALRSPEVQALAFSPIERM